MFFVLSSLPYSSINHSILSAADGPETFSIIFEISDVEKPSKLLLQLVSIDTKTKLIIFLLYIRFRCYAICITFSV
jgi:hypothetical protein